MQSSVRISAEPDPVAVTDMEPTPRAPGSARNNYDQVDDPGTLRAVLKAKDEKIATLEQRLDMSKEALNGVKDRYKEKVETMDELVVSLRKKLQTKSEQVNLLAQAVKDQGGNPAQVLGSDGGHISPPSSFDPAEIEDKYARQLAALMSQNRQLTSMLEAQQRGQGQERDGRLERELMNERSKTQAAQHRLGELEAKLREMVDTLQNVPFLEDRIRVLGQSLQAKDVQIADLRQQNALGGDASMVQALEQELADARSLSEEFNLEKARLQQDTHRLREELIARDNQIHAIQQRVVGEQGTKQELLDQVEKMMRSVDAMRIERDLLLSQQSGQQSEQERIATLEQELYAAQTARGESSKRIAQLEREVLQFRGAVEEMVRKEGDKEKAMANSDLKQQQLQGVIDSLQMQLEGHKNSADANAQRAVELEKLIERAQEESKQKQQALQQQLDASRAQNSSMFAASHAQQEMTQGLEREVSAKDQSIRTLTEQVQDFQRKAKKEGEEVAALNEHVQHLNAHVKARDTEINATRHQLARMEDEVANLKKEKDRIQYSLTQISQECEAQQEKLRSLRADEESMSTVVEQLETTLAATRREKDDLLARCAKSAEALVEAHDKNNQYEQRIADMSAQVGMVTKQVQSKDVSLANLVSARQTLSTRTAELEGQVASEQAEKRALAKKLEEAMTHSQLTETRGIGLEKRVRELMEQSKELAVLRDQLRDRDIEIERQQTKIVEVENALKQSQQSVVMLGEKDATINEWVRRNNGLLQELELAHNDKAKMQEQLHAMAHQLSSATGKTDELQRQLDKASDSMLLSDKILIVSKEQTAAISQLQERLEEQEVLLRAKERERQDLETASRRENSNLRDQIMSLTQANQALQNESENLKDGMHSNMMIQRRDVSQSQLDELQDQLMSAIDQSQNHYMEANRLRLRQQRLQASTVHRLFRLKCQPLAAEALHAWQQLAEGSRGSRVPLRSIQSSSSASLRGSAPPPTSQGFLATVEVNDASGHVVLSSGASYVLEKSNAPPINFAPSSNYTSLPSDILSAPTGSGYTKDWSNPRTVRMSSNSSPPMPMSEQGSSLSYQPPPSIPAPSSFHHSEYHGSVQYQRSGTPPAIPSPYQASPHHGPTQDPYQASGYHAPQRASPTRGSVPPESAAAWQASQYQSQAPHNRSPPAVHIQSPYAAPQQQAPPALSAPQVLQASPYQAQQHQTHGTSNSYQQSSHNWAPQVGGNGVMSAGRGFDTTEIIL